MSESLSTFLKHKMVEHNLMSAECTERSGLNAAQWSRLINGHSKTRRQTIPRIARAFGIATNDPSIDEFYTMAGFSPPPRAEAAPVHPPVSYTISLEENIRVKVTGKDRGFIAEQSVQAVLLYEILQELRRLNQ